MDYREHKIYQALAKIVTDAGITIKYEDMGDAIGEAYWLDSISMTDDFERFGDEWIPPTEVLASEMASILHERARASITPTFGIGKAMCDVLGGFLIVLAQETMNENAKKELEAKRNGRG